MTSRGHDSSSRTAEFLLELGCEEIPAWMIEPACAQLKASLEKLLHESSLLSSTSPTSSTSSSSSITVFGGPRRLTVIIPSLRLKQADVTREVTGPAKAAAYDAQGRPTRAAEGFAASKGVAVKDLFLVKLPKGEFVAARQTTLGRTASAVLAEVLPRALAEIAWPKAMTWPVLTKEGPAPGTPRFIRPVRWLLALIGGKGVPFEFCGVHSGDRTWGHRTLGKPAIRVRNSKDYRAVLRRNFVLVDPAERRKKIEQELAKLASRHGLRVHADADLLARVTYLNEFPAVILGGFDSAFLELPQEILITVMRDHQKYFAVEKASGGLAPHFLAVINSDRDRAGKMRHGHERVLRARFADAKFFWDSDQVKCRLADNLSKLDGVTYEASLGSYGLKVKRMRALAGSLASEHVSLLKFARDRAAAFLPPGQALLDDDANAFETVDRAAMLAKCDLVTEMVREFTELQGIVGGLYAAAQGESPKVSQAIYDHYRPAGLDDRIPLFHLAHLVALADKLDTLVACFAIGKIPSGSSDPFALRRAAMGIVRIVFEGFLRLSLRAVVAAAATVLADTNPHIRQPANLQAQVLDFLADRARFYFQDRRGYAFDEVKAAMAAGSDDLLDFGARLEALHRVRSSENFVPLAAAFKRIRNILEKSAAKEPVAEYIDPARFTAEEESALHTAALAAATESARLKESRQYEPALARIATLRPLADRFFDKVLVMAEDPAVRANRLALLRNLLREFSTIADFSEIVTDSAASKKP